MVIQWNNSKWEKVLASETIIHPTANGLYPPKKGWPDGMEFDYDCNWIDDDGNIISRNYINFLKTVNLTGNETIKFSSKCEVDETLLLPVQGVNNLTYSEYQELDEYASLEDGKCGVGSLTPLLDDDEDPIYDINGDLIYTQPLPIGDGLVKDFRLMAVKRSLDSSGGLDSVTIRNGLILTSRSVSPRCTLAEFDGNDFLNWHIIGISTYACWEGGIDDNNTVHLGMHTGSKVAVRSVDTMSGLVGKLSSELLLTSLAFTAVGCTVVPDSNNIIINAGKDGYACWVTWDGSAYTKIDEISTTGITTTFKIIYDPYTDTLSQLYRTASDDVMLRILKLNSTTNTIDILATIELINDDATSLTGGQMAYHNGEILTGTGGVNPMVHKVIYNPTTTSLSLAYTTTIKDGVYPRGILKLNDTQYALVCYAGDTRPTGAYLMTDDGESLSLVEITHMAATMTGLKTSHVNLMTVDDEQYIIMGTLDGDHVAFKVIV